MGKKKKTKRPYRSSLNVLIVVATTMLSRSVLRARVSLKTPARGLASSSSYDDTYEGQPSTSGVMGLLAKWYQGSLNGTLRKYGLRYEDVILSDHEDYKQALKYLTEEERQNREKRIHRAIDLAAKHEELPKEIQEIQEPRKFYITPLMT